MAKTRTGRYDVKKVLYKEEVSMESSGTNVVGEDSIALQRHEGRYPLASLSSSWCRCGVEGPKTLNLTHPRKTGASHGIEPLTPLATFQTTCRSFRHTGPLLRENGKVASQRQVDCQCFSSPTFSDDFPS